MVMTNQSQDNRAFVPEFYVILEEERRKDREYRERSWLIAQEQQKFLDILDGVEVVEPELKLEEVSKKEKKVTKKKVKKESKEEVELKEIGPTSSLPGQKTSDGWWNVKARNDMFCSKCSEPIIKGSQYYGKSSKRVHPDCK